MKVLGSGKSQPSVRRTRCFTSFSMTGSHVMSETYSAEASRSLLEEPSYSTERNAAFRLSMIFHYIDHD